MINLKEKIECPSCKEIKEPHQFNIIDKVIAKRCLECNGKRKDKKKPKKVWGHRQAFMGDYADYPTW